MEVYQQRVNKLGKRKADLKFIIDVLLLFRPSIIKPIEGYHNLNNYGMIKNYFMISLRQLIINKTFTFINVFGLVLGISFSTMLYTYVSNELSYDSFHQKSDRIYRALWVNKSIPDNVRNFGSIVPLIGVLPLL